MASLPDLTDSIVRSRAPLRISFAGGGTDVSPYCDERGGAVLSASIDRYAYATLKPGDTKFQVSSLDYDCSVACPVEDEFVYDGQLDLAKNALDYFRQEHGLSHGLEAFLHNDAPPGSGLGSSSAITVAMIASLTNYLGLALDSYQMAETAYHVERVLAGISGGRQDQYAATFGGFNLIEFADGHVIVNALRVRPETLYELEYNLVFAHLGGSRFSAHIIDKQVANYSMGNAAAISAMDDLKALAYEMKDALLLGRVSDIGELLHHAWESKKRMADGISTPRIDEIYDEARRAGALGGKISGAGGGGYIFFVCRAGARFAVQDSLRRLGIEMSRFGFTHEGVQCWRVGMRRPR